ncbi:GTPase HflX [Mycoplasmatota bacterium zrk1]
MEVYMERKEKALLVGVSLYNQDILRSMDELSNLARACNIEVVGTITQNLNRINVSHYIGTGKVSEVHELVRERSVEIVVFDDELSPTQIRNLEDALGCRVLDRTVLILDIFAKRAKTKEAKLQVEIARLNYNLPRLVGQNESLGRQSGGVGTYNKGSGEKKLELDRRGIKQRINKLSKELALLVSRRKNQRKQRQKNEIPVVSLVGYTNAGKSTVMNALLNLYNPTTKTVYEEDMLFATLETSVRNIKLPGNKSFLLTDTVGFISKLPHHLIKAFRSTLEEVKESDLLIHVVDLSNPDHMEQVLVTENTLKELGIEDIPVIYVYNKIDLVDNFSESEGVHISAKNKIGIDILIEEIEKRVLRNYTHCKMLIPYNNGDTLSYLLDNANILSTSYEDDGTLIALECKESDYHKYKRYIM